MENQIQKEAYRVAEFCQAFGISRAQAYIEMASKRLKYFKRGRMTLITRAAAQDWLMLCQANSDALPSGGVSPVRGA